MGANFGFEKSESLKRASKNIGICLVCLFIASCKSGPKAIPEKSYQSSGVIVSKSSPLGTQITSMGDNDSFSFSHDGNKILYVSKSRLSHKNAQAYELDLISMKERRVTFSDGEVSTPIYGPEGKIFYASTTDEIKERPSRIAKTDEATPRTEIYSGDLAGAEISRMTQHPGFDGELSVLKEDIYFTTLNNKQLDIMRLRGRVVYPQVADPKISERSFVTNGVASAWVSQKTENDEIINVREKQKTTILEFPKGKYILQQLTDEGLLVVASTHEDGKFHIYIYDLNKKCFSRALPFKQDIREAKVTSDKNWIYFSTTEAKEDNIPTEDSLNQIFKKKMDWDNLKCLQSNSETKS